ncbi:glycosyltransferase family 1 protein [Acidothermaceae bacterium B102]|nr:glycosyltransferase family 1 protein [Acidothermaceae bacterium B102]
MRVALDATPLIGPRTGVGHYVAGLVDGLIGLPDAPDVTLTAFTFRGRGELPAPPGAHVAGRPAPARLLQAAWLRSNFPPVELLTGRSDVFHGTNFVLPPRRRAAGVVMVHDLAYEKLPESVTPASLRYRTLVPKALRDPRVVVTSPTEAVADEVAEFYRIDRSRVVATPLGVADEWYGAEPASASWLTSRGLPQRYLLFVGSLEPRKNLVTLLAAHQAARADNPDVPTLLLVGPPGWGEAIDPATMRAGDVVTTGYLPHAQLRTLVAGAVALALPSRYEGFGLPLLEAFATGTPVIAGKVPALQEISAGLAPIVDPDDVDGLAAELAAVSTAQPDLVAADARRARAREFTWARCAEATLRAYQLALSG